MRLFLFNPRASFSAVEAAQRARIPLSTARTELSLLLKIKLLRGASVRRVRRFVLNDNFEYRAALQALLLNASARAAELPQRVRAAGTMRLIIVAGAFMGDLDAALDILFVGERINERKLRSIVRTLESELGRELRYASLSTPDFFYRLNVSDKLLRDVLDYPHSIVFDRLNIGLK
jgi:hypothetical protein